MSGGPTRSTDFAYKVWGDQAYEDFYFYPDGFGTRVLNLKRKPETKYEVSEFIVLTPQSAYPLDVLPKNMVDILALDGSKQEILFPDHALYKGVFPDAAFVTSDKPSMYRIRMHKDEAKSAVYFYPTGPDYPMGPFGPFYDRGELVTPAYWGSHWPLSRGKTTGWSIDDRIHYSPAHNSLLAWGTNQTPTPLRQSTISTIDTLGRSQTMAVERWAWLIGMTDATDGELLQWAQSFSRPPSVEVIGADLDFESYVPERRAIRVLVKDRVVSVKLSPNQYTINPVFELVGAPEGPIEILQDGKAAPAEGYAWDGKTLWIKASLSKPSRFEFRFGSGK